MASAFSRFFGGGRSSKSRKIGGGKRSEGSEVEEEELGLGVTEQLQEFVKTFTVSTFKEFRIRPTQQDGPCISGNSQQSDSKPNSNTQKDLTVWQERHALCILSTVKEISELRYVLCPRHMKEKDFWRIYFELVKNYVAPYEMHAIRKEKLRTRAEAEISLEDGAVEVEMMATK